MQALDHAVQDYLTALTERTQLLLLADLVGVYAAGSLGLDAFDPDRSDIDIAIVCSAVLPMATKQAIVAALRHEALPCPARGLELVVYRSDIAAAATSDPGFEMELNTGPRMDFRATYAGADRQERDGTFWYAVDRSILAQSSRVLLGPPSPQVFRTVGDEQLVELLIASLRWHLAADVVDEQVASWTDDAVLNSCRALQRMRTGRWLSKAEAGRQLMAEHRTPSRVVEQSLAAKSGGRRPGVREARAFQREVLADLEQFTRG